MSIRTGEKHYGSATSGNQVHCWQFRRFLFFRMICWNLPTLVRVEVSIPNNRTRNTYLLAGEKQTQNWNSITPLQYALSVEKEQCPESNIAKKYIIVYKNHCYKEVSKGVWFIAHLGGTSEVYVQTQPDGAKLDDCASASLGTFW